MNYLKTFNLAREPFSNTPDPEFFFQSRQHLGCLQKIEVAVRLRRGLNVVIGDVGSGKTTICRQILRRFAADEELETHLILDPSFDSPSDFLGKVSEMMLGRRPLPGANDWQVKEDIKQYLFRRGVEDQKTVVLIIDEGQKIPVYGLEILREFLNYETNEYKLLQIVIFAQREFEPKIKALPNFADRINLYHRLEPLSFSETRDLIHFRLHQASDTPNVPNMFTYPALYAIYQASGGYPRKIINLCHLCTLALIVENRTKCDFFLVRRCRRGIVGIRGFNWRRAAAGALLACLVAVLVVWWDPVDLIRGNAPFDRLSTLGTRILGIVKTTEPPSETPKEEPPATEADLKTAGTETAPGAEVPEPPVESAPAPAPVAATTAEKPAMASELEPPSEPMVPSIPEASADSGAVGPDQPLVQVEPVEPTATASVAEPQPAEPVVEKPVMKGPKLPESLGGVPIKRGETLSGMILRVYGVLGPEILGRVVNANPHLEDLNKIPIDRTIYFPAARQTVTATTEPRYWVQIAETETLAEAFAMLRSTAAEARKIRVVPYFHPQNGVTFAVVLWSYYPSREEAQNQLSGLPGSIGDQAKVVTLYDPDGIYYADPFQRKQERSETY
jgi:general secretion pathway protein A